MKTKNIAVTCEGIFLPKNDNQLIHKASEQYIYAIKFEGVKVRVVNINGDRMMPTTLFDTASCQKEAFPLAGSMKNCFSHSSGASGLVFWRSALSFRPQASSTQEEKLASGFSTFSRSMLASISSNTSWGKRIPLYDDLLFLCPVLTVLFSIRCLNDKKHTAHFITSKVFKHIKLDYDYASDLKCLNTSPAGKAHEVPK